MDTTSKTNEAEADSSPAPNRPDRRLLMAALVMATLSVGSMAYVWMPIVMQERQKEVAPSDLVPITEFWDEHDIPRRQGTDETTIRRGSVGEYDAAGPILVDTDGIALHGFDSVAYFTEERAMRGSPDYEFEYQSVVFRFASRAHRDLFADDPERYMPAYGGYCAFGVANGYKDGMHPEAFEIIDGRLFLNLTPGIHRSWRHRADELIERGDEFWIRIHSTRMIGPGL